MLDLKIIAQEVKFENSEISEQVTSQRFSVKIRFLDTNNPPKK